MATLSSGEIVSRASRAGIAIPAFNVPYLPMVQPVIRAVADQDSFALIETARLEWIRFGSVGPAAVMAEFRRWEDPQHVRIHLDHVPAIDEEGQRIDCIPVIQEALLLGYQSVMVDGSRLKLDENIQVTRRVVEMAHRAGVPCEAELGAVFGHEAGPLPPYEELFSSGRGFTDVAQAARFVRETGCDWLSVAIGNVHGAVSEALRDQKKVTARLDLEHLEKLRQAVHGIPLVLHGGSEVDRSLLLAAIQKGIAKVNIGTEIRQAYHEALTRSGDVATAQEAVYQRTVWLISSYFDLQGSRRILAEATA